MSEPKTRRAFPLVLVPDIPKILYRERAKRLCNSCRKKENLIIFNESRRNKARRRTEAHMEKNVWIRENRLMSISKSSTHSLPYQAPLWQLPSHPFPFPLPIHLQTPPTTPPAPPPTDPTHTPKRTHLHPAQTSNLKPQTSKPTTT